LHCYETAVGLGIPQIPLDHNRECLTNHALFQHYNIWFSESN